MPSSVPAPRGVCKGFLFFYYEYQTRRNLVWGIPDVPGFPEIPEVPELPELPELPEHPEAEHKKKELSRFLYPVYQCVLVYQWAVV